MANPTLNNGQSYLPSTGQGKVNQWHGVYPAVVISNADPAGKGALQLQVPMVSGTTTTTWAPPLTPYTTLPAAKTLVYAAYIGGDVSKPVWMWNEQIITQAGGTSVTYAPVAPASPKVGDVWYPTITANGQTTTSAAQVWTYNSGTSTYSWVSQGSSPTTTYSQPTPPTGNIATGSTWIDTSGGSNTMNYYNGSSWEALPIGNIVGQQISPGSIGPGILGASAVTNYNIANNSISTTNIQPDSISTPLLQANAVTAQIIESGIVVAGIVNSTEIDSAVFRGPNYIINTQGVFFYTNPI